MNRQKLATIGCIILPIVFSVSFGLFIHFKAFMPTVSDNYEKTLYYPEALYKEYQKEAEGMIARHEYTCQYPAQTKFYSEDSQITLVIEIGESKGNNYWCVLFPPLCLIEAEESDDVEYSCFIGEIIKKFFN